VTEEIHREDWEVLGVEPGADLEKVHRAYHTRRSLFAGSSLATYSMLGTSEREKLLERIDEAFMRISNAVADMPVQSESDFDEGSPDCVDLAGMRTPTDLVADPGGFLRYHRLIAGLTLEQVSVETKVRPNLLEAVEKEDWDRLPAPVFVRGFVVQVARLLHMDDPEALASSFIDKMRAERGED